MKTSLILYSDGDGPKLPDFGSYVFQYQEVVHSGIGANVAYLNSNQWGYWDEAKAADALRALEHYANDSITAYLAIAYWAEQDLIPGNWITQNGESTLPRDILARLTKPTRYMRMTCEMVDIDP